MQLAHRWLDRNLSRLEFVVSWLVIIFIIGLFIRTTLVIFSKAERTMVNTTINNINTALKYRATFAVMRGNWQIITRLAQENPFDLVQTQRGLQMFSGNDSFTDLSARISTYSTPPPNYLGELDDPNPAKLKAGNWYFDTSDKTLNYLVRNAEFFHSNLGAVPRIKLKVIVDYNDLNGNNRFDPGVDAFKSVSLRSIGRYSWTE